MSSVVVQNSTFLDDFGNNQATPQQFAQLANSTSLANAQAVLGQLYAFNALNACDGFPCRSLVDRSRAALKRWPARNG